MKRIGLILPLVVMALMVGAGPLMAEDKGPVVALPAPVSAAAAVALIGPALHVANLDKAVAFYTAGLGMKVAMQLGPPDHRETMLSSGNDPRQPGVMLLSDSRPANPAMIAPEIAQRSGFDRLVLRVHDLANVAARLRRLGYTVSEVKSVAMGYRMAIAADADGYRLELVESPIQ